MPKLAIIGASYLQLPLYLKARELGIKTIGFAWAEGAVAKDVCNRFYDISTIEKESILKICRDETIDGILTIASDIAVPTVNYVANELKLVANSIRSGLLATNKYLMRQALKKGGLCSPMFYNITDKTDINNLKRSLRFPVIVKPVDRSGSKGVAKVDNLENLDDAINDALKQSLIKQAIIESFIEGVEVSVETISYKGQHYILAITDKRTSGAPHFVELEHHQPSQLAEDIQNKIQQETIKALDALEIEFGASHAEFIISGNTVYATEVGARMGGDFIGSDLVYLSTGYDFLKGIINVALHNFIEPVFNYNKCSGVLFYTKLTPKVKEMAAGNEFLKPFIVNSDFNSNINSDLKQSADRSGFLIYQSHKRITYNNQA